MLGTRIKQAREAAGLNQRELAAACGISAMAISKYERDLSVPSSRVLMALADALGVRVEYFFRSQHVALDKLEFRKHARLPAKQEKRVLADAREQLERWMALEELLPNEWIEPFTVPKGLLMTVSSGDDIERVAMAVRKACGLGTEPIVDLIEVLEENGLKVLLSEHAQASDFDGLAAQANGHTVILVGADLPGDRQRFTIAHELGHLVRAGALAVNWPRTRSAPAHRFAGAFWYRPTRSARRLGRSDPGSSRASSGYSSSSGA
ncbi:MAG: XRE family transcriptional regulator [Xanthomonadales bacterium]|nr:XRE family transcriptional regulator [Xanthomonadales bacterium]